VVVDVRPLIGSIKTTRASIASIIDVAIEIFHSTILSGVV
jgi:hypothetical protein